MEYETPVLSFPPKCFSRAGSGSFSCLVHCVANTKIFIAVAAISMLNMNCSSGLLQVMRRNGRTSALIRHSKHQCQGRGPFGRGAGLQCQCERGMRRPKLPASARTSMPVVSPNTRNSIQQQPDHHNFPLPLTFGVPFPYPPHQYVIMSRPQSHPPKTDNIREVR